MILAVTVTILMMVGLILLQKRREFERMDTTWPQLGIRAHAHTPDTGMHTRKHTCTHAHMNTHAHTCAHADVCVGADTFANMDRWHPR